MLNNFCKFTMLIQQPPEVLRSKEDLSVNFVWSLGDTDAIEARFVRRTDDYFIVYLSSHTGCNQACRFCHLTATKQVSMQDATLDDFLVQADAVLAYYDEEVRSGRQPKATKVHFNWMARGEPFLNPVVLHQYKELFEALAFRAKIRRLTVEFKLSSIFPNATPLEALMGPMSQPNVRTYYSLYSLENQFRKRWVPKAHDPVLVLDWIGENHRTATSPLDIALHWAFIAGENDSSEGVQAIADAVEARGIHAKFNLVRYNPFSAAQGKESTDEVLIDRLELMRSCSDQIGTRMVPRVGFDVRASCGMFVHPSEHLAGKLGKVVPISDCS